MNRRCVIALLTLSSLFARFAGAETPPVALDPDIDNTFKENPADHVDDIGQAIATQLNKMVQTPTDQAAVNSAREWLIKAATFNGQAAGQFQATYTDQLNKAFLGLLKNPQTPAVARLNMAILIPKLSGRIFNLAPAVIQLLNDKSVVVVMRAERAAQTMLEEQNQPPGFNAGDRDKLLDAVVASIANHPNTPEDLSLAEDAYKAIDASLFPVNAFPVGPDLDGFIAANLKLQAARIKLYGTGVPQDPYADTFATGFLLSGDHQEAVWNEMNADQRLQAIQQAVDILSLGSQRLQGSDEELMKTLTSEGYWMQQFAKANLPGDQQTLDAASALYAISVSASPETVQKAANDLVVALKQGVSVLNLPNPLKDSDNSNSAGSTPTGAAVAQ